MSHKFAMELLLVSYSHKCWESNIIMADSLDVQNQREQQEIYHIKMQARP